MAREIDRLFSLSGRTAIVVGAASGIGKATAGLLAEAGATVVVADRDIDGATAVAASVRSEGGAARAAHVDITDEASVIELFGGESSADVVVNCVGIYPKVPILETTVEDWDAVFDVNLKGAFLCLREAGKQMIAGGAGGSIVNVSSISSLHPAVIGNGAYGASKGGLNVLTKNAALEWGPHGIRVNAVAPGGTLTEGALKPSPAPRSGPILQPGRVMMERFADPVEMAAAILYLSAPASNYMTGQMLVLDGGFLLT